MLIKHLLIHRKERFMTSMDKKDYKMEGWERQDLTFLIFLVEVHFKDLKESQKNLEIFLFQFKLNYHKSILEKQFNRK